MYRRGSDEFGRVLAFSDGIFAIAMTLLVIAITVPTISDTDSAKDLADALGDNTEAYISFFISFAVIGRYWVAHHQFFALLTRMDTRLVWVNLIYLGFVALPPVSDGRVGHVLRQSPRGVGLCDRRRDRERPRGAAAALCARLRADAAQMSPEIYRWAVVMSFTPVLFFLASVPVAFISTTLATLLWFGTVPLAIATRNRTPPGFDEYFGDQDRLQQVGSS